tara:strand:+ start:1067 stop:1786 length:720 start_codon:yes stop_codon:yes gene_type:complete
VARARQLASRGNYDTLLLDASATDTDVGEQILLDSSDGSGSDIGFAILQEDATDNPDVEVTSFIDPNETLIFTSPPKIETNPSFKVFLSANQAVAHGTFTKVNLDLVAHDIGGFYDTSNNRYQPTIPGYYRFFLRCYAGTAVDVYAIITMIYKNGIGYQSGGIYSRIQMSGLTNDDMAPATLVVSEVLYMDGDDYIEAYNYQASEDGQACSVLGDGPGMTMSGYLIARSNISPQTGINV